jgi:hypothetical protein
MADNNSPSINETLYSWTCCVRCWVEVVVRSIAIGCLDPFKVKDVFNANADSCKWFLGGCCIVKARWYTYCKRCAAGYLCG